MKRNHTTMVKNKIPEQKEIIIHAGLWCLKLLFTISLFCTLGFIAGTLFFGESFYEGAHEFDKRFLRGAEEMIIPFLGPGNTLILIITAIIFLIPWRKMLKKSKGVSTIRDLISINIFIWFSLALLIGMKAVRTSSLEFTGLDFGIAGGFVVTYLIVGIANFGGMGGIGEIVKPVPVIKEFVVVMIIIALGSLPGLFLGTTEFLWYLEIVYYFFDIALVYITGFCAKILLYPEEIVTFSLEKDILKVLFGLLSLAVLLPFAGAGLSLIALGLFSRFSESAWLIQAHLFTPALYIFHLMLHDPVRLLFLLAAIALHMSYYGKDIAEHSRIKEPDTVPFYLKIPAAFSFRQEQGISIPLWITGSVSLAVTILYVYFLPWIIDTLKL